MTASHVPAAVIFDLYGTLLHIVDPKHVYAKLAKRSPLEFREAMDIALKHSLPSLSSFASTIGVVATDDIPKLEQELTSEIESIELFEDALPTLIRLKQHGIRTAVISNLATLYIQPFIDLGLHEYVDVAVFSCVCGFKKPEIPVYELAIQQLGCDAGEAVMVGDSIRCDVDGPSHIGLKGIHLARSGESSAQGVISSLDAVLEICHL